MREAVANESSRLRLSHPRQTEWRIGTRLGRSPLNEVRLPFIFDPRCRVQRRITDFRHFVALGKLTRASKSQGRAGLTVPMARV
jgi:hypothetical protein